MNEIGSRAGEDLTSPNVHGDAHHVVRGNGCRRGGCRCSHLSSTSLRFEVGCCAAGGVNLSFRVVGVGSSSVKGTIGSGGGEQLLDLISWTTASGIRTPLEKGWICSIEFETCAGGVSPGNGDQSSDCPGAKAHGNSESRAQE